MGAGSPTTSRARGNKIAEKLLHPSIEKHVWTGSRCITRIGVAFVRPDRYVAFRSAAAVD